MTLSIQTGESHRKRLRTSEQPDYPRKKICSTQDRLIMKLHNSDTMEKTFAELSKFFADQGSHRLLVQRDLLKKLDPLVFEAYLSYLSTRVKMLEIVRSAMESMDIDSSRSLRQKRRVINGYPRCIIQGDVLSIHELRVFNP